jgi:uncharacterized membrane protein YdjX (TVP38/TMEM64 family)
VQFINELLELYNAFLSTHAWIAPVAAFVLPIVEAIVPALPLTAIVSVNLAAMSATYGAVLGTALTIALSASGSFLAMAGIFLLIRKTLAKRFLAKIEANKFGAKFVNVAASGNAPLIMSLLCNPLLPSSIMNYALAFTKISVPRYLLLTGISRIIVILMLVFLGSLFNVQEHPLNVLWLLLVYAVFLLIGVLYRRFCTRKQKTTNE